MSDFKLYSSSDFELDGGDARIGIVAARFNDEIVNRLLEAAVATLQQRNVADERLIVVRVPGAFEIPLVCQRLAATGSVDAVIALGCIIRGDTPHFDYVCSESARGVLDVSLQLDLPVINGILTTDDLAQAEARAGVGDSPHGNKGADAALAALEMLSLLKRLDDNT